MARPKVPLISKRKALEVALDIIDNEGIDALSIRRLAERLNVNGASLYHHFQNKEEIVVGTAKLALEDVRVPQGHEEPWRVWVVRNARRLQAAFRAHPDLVPIMLRRETLDIGIAQLDATAVRLEEEGVPVGAIAPILEGLELYAIGSALHEAGGTDSPEFLEKAPHLYRAFAERVLSLDEIFDLVCEQIIDAALRTAEERAAAPQPAPARKTAARRPRKTRATA